MVIKHKEPHWHKAIDYFHAKEKAKEYFLIKYAHDCGSMIHHMSNTDAEVSITFRSSQDYTCKELFHVRFPLK